MQKFETINYSLENQVATVSLNRPEKLNAISDHFKKPDNLNSS